MRIYSVFDRGGEEYGPPFIAKNDAVALRCFINLLKDTDERLRGDFMLYQVGGWDSEIGVLTHVEAREVNEMREDD